MDGSGGASLASVFEGWYGYRLSLVNAVSGLTPEQMAFRPAPDQKSVAELTRHIVCGRLNWWLRMDPPGAEVVLPHIPEWTTDQDGNRYVVEDAFPTGASELVQWLEWTGDLIQTTLDTWTVDDLNRTYRHTYWGKVFAVSYQWTIWRILSHDQHHGGQLSLTLFLQGIEPPELGSLGGHLTEPPLADV